MILQKPTIPVGSTKTSTEEMQLKMYGRVQGVFFRVTVQKWASELGLTGYAKNLVGGGVLIVAQGEREKLLELQEKCSKGPPRGHIMRMEEQWRKPQQRYSTFSIH